MCVMIDHGFKNISNERAVRFCIHSTLMSNVYASAALDSLIQMIPKAKWYPAPEISAISGLFCKIIVIPKLISGTLNVWKDISLSAS